VVAGRKIVESPERVAHGAVYAGLVIYVECNEHFCVFPKRLELLRTKRRNGIIVMVITGKETPMICRC